MSHLKCFLILLFVIFLAFPGCKNYNIPKGFPKPDKMADILTELHTLESTLSYGSGIPQIPTKEMPGYYKGVLDKFGYTYEQFDTIRKWYVNNPFLYQKVYDRVIVNSSKRETELGLRLDKEKELEKLNAPEITPPTELWIDSVNFVVSPADTIDKRLPFRIDADSLELSGILRLTARYKFLVDDVSRNPQIMLSAFYADSTADTTYLAIPHSFQQKNAMLDLALNDEKKTIEIAGFLLLQDSLINASVEISDVSLTVIEDTVIVKKELKKGFVERLQEAR